jgi:hypothetical protein
VIFNKVAIEQNSIVPSSFSALVTQVQLINGNTTPGKKAHKTPSEPIAGCSGVDLSSQLCKKLRSKG